MSRSSDFTASCNAGNRAVIIAVHHPPLSVDALHAGSTGMQVDLDSVCSDASAKHVGESADHGWKR
jgi:hypothetical protein